MTAPRFLLLPGWQDSGPTHWQSQWQQSGGFHRVQQDDWWWPRRGDWMTRLEDELLTDPRPTVLVAHSLGCHLAAAWAGHSQHTARVIAALLVAPPDLLRGGTPPQLHNWLPIANRLLPFASTAVLSADDPFCSLARGRQIAQGWGSEVECLSAAGHINGDSGLGDWPAGMALLQALVQRAGLARTAATASLVTPAAALRGAVAP
jgi:predicted alpha/beta hydrolase family esterase